MGEETICFGDVRTSANSVVRVQAVEYRGKVWLDVRRFCPSFDGLRPTPNGVRLAADPELVSELVAALQSAETVLRLPVGEWWPPEVLRQDRDRG